LLGCKQRSVPLGPSSRRPVCRKEPPNCFDVKPTWRYLSGLVQTPSVELQEFLRDCVASYEELETLLLLARDPTTSWSAGEVADALKVPLEVAETALSKLATLDGLVAARPVAGTQRVAYTPRTAELAALVAELIDTYAKQRLTVVQLMSANAMARMRGAAARRLADAFRIERGKK
jgi:hypothetical protein